MSIENRLKKLEEIRSKEIDIPVAFINFLDDGEKEICALVKGKERILSEEEWKKCSDKTVTIIDDIPD